MSLEKIEASVAVSSRTEADRILRAAEQSAHERIARETEAVRRAETLRYHAAARSLEDVAARAVSRVRGEAAKELLQRRNTVLDAIFDAAKQQILALPQLDYVNELRARLSHAAGTGGGKIRVHPDDRNAVASMLAQFNTGRADNAQVVIDADTPLAARGGFVFVTDTYEIDQTLDTIVTDLKYELGPQIATELFAE